MIDEALLRPGRLEVHVEIGLPDEAGRLQILQIHTRGMVRCGSRVETAAAHTCVRCCGYWERGRLGGESSMFWCYEQTLLVDLFFSGKYRWSLEWGSKSVEGRNKNILRISRGVLVVLGSFSWNAFHFSDRDPSAVSLSRASQVVRFCEFVSTLFTSLFIVPSCSTVVQGCMTDHTFYVPIV